MYKWAAQTGKDKVAVIDWGDRILLNKITTEKHTPEDRWVLDLSAPESKIATVLSSLWRKWSLKWFLSSHTDYAKRDRGND